MANTKIIKTRIKTAKNISQITKAMEMVAASKMRRAQQQALASRPYAQNLKKVLLSLISASSQIQHRLMQENGSPTAAVLLITSDKGLCGGLNTNLLRTIKDFASQESNNLKFLNIGKKGRNFLTKSNYSVLADFPQISENISFPDTLAVSGFIINAFLKGEIGKVYISFSNFISTLSQKPKIVQILPISIADLSRELALLSKEETTQQAMVKKDYLIEPSAQTIADWLLPYFLELVIYHYLLEAKAAEHSARMVAMKNASENAQDIVSELSLSYNKARQAQITAQIAEVAVASMTIN